MLYNLNLIFLKTCNIGHRPQSLSRLLFSINKLSASLRYQLTKEFGMEMMIKNGMHPFDKRY